MTLPLKPFPNPVPPWSDAMGPVVVRGNDNLLAGAVNALYATITALQATVAALQTEVDALESGAGSASAWNFDALLNLPVWLPDDLRFQLELARDNADSGVTNG